MKALVNHLTVIKNGKSEHKRLVYIEDTAKGVKITPFERERADFEYLDSFSITI